MYPIAKTGVGQQGVEQKATIQQKYRGFDFGAFRLLLLMLAAGILVFNVISGLNNAIKLFRKQKVSRFAGSVQHWVRRY